MGRSFLDEPFHLSEQQAKRQQEPRWRLHKSTRPEENMVGWLLPDAGHLVDRLLRLRACVRFSKRSLGWKPIAGTAPARGIPVRLQLHVRQVAWVHMAEAWGADSERVVASATCGWWVGDTDAIRLSLYLFLAVALLPWQNSPHETRN